MLSTALPATAFRSSERLGWKVERRSVRYQLVSSSRRTWRWRGGSTALSLNLGLVELLSFGEGGALLPIASPCCGDNSVSGMLTTLPDQMPPTSSPISQRSWRRGTAAALVPIRSITLTNRSVITAIAYHRQAAIPRLIAAMTRSTLPLLSSPESQEDAGRALPQASEQPEGVCSLEKLDDKFGWEFQRFRGGRW